MTRHAVIDVGTNSVKFHVGECQADGTWTTVTDRADVSRLGDGILETQAIAPAAMERTAQAIAGMAAEAASTVRRRRHRRRYDGPARGDEQSWPSSTW